MLQQTVHARRPEQVLAAHDVGDALQRIIDHDRQMIAVRRLLAREDNVAPGFRPGNQGSDLAVRACALLVPCQLPVTRDGRFDVEPEGEGRVYVPLRNTISVSPEAGNPFSTALNSCQIICCA